MTSERALPGLVSSPIAGHCLKRVPSVPGTLRRTSADVSHGERSRVEVHRAWCFAREVEDELDSRLGLTVERRLVRESTNRMDEAAARASVGSRVHPYGGASCWNRTSDPHRVKVVFYR
jgi:hypothetical protein